MDIINKNPGVFVKGAGYVGDRLSVTYTLFNTGTIITEEKM